MIAATFPDDSTAVGLAANEITRQLKTSTSCAPPSDTVAVTVYTPALPAVSVPVIWPNTFAVRFGGRPVTDVNVSPSRSASVATRFTATTLPGAFACVPGFVRTGAVLGTMKCSTSDGGPNWFEPSYAQTKKSYAPP